jgi:hypothetical protein
MNKRFPVGTKVRVSANGIQEFVGNNEQGKIVGSRKRGTYDVQMDQDGYTLCLKVSSLTAV